jgi:glycosyltransferase involved in cell wall biosynthesis
MGWQNKPLYRFGVSPNKLIDYIMAAKPVVHSTNAGNDIIKETGSGISVEAENPEEIATAIEKLANLTTVERQNLGLKGKKHVLKNLTYSKLSVNFLNAIK